MSFLLPAWLGNPINNILIEMKLGVSHSVYLVCIAYDQQSFTRLALSTQDNLARIYLQAPRSPHQMKALNLSPREIFFPGHEAALMHLAQLVRSHRESPNLSSWSAALSPRGLDKARKSGGVQNA